MQLQLLRQRQNVIAFQFTASFPPNVLLDIQTMAALREVRLNDLDLDFIFADEDSDEKGIIDEE